MPVDMRRYPPNWRTEIRPRILARAGDRCEQCWRCIVEYHFAGSDVQEGF